MNVFPLMMISLAWITRRIESQISSSGTTEISYLWSQCYEDLGCINNTEIWYHQLLRPIKEPPLPRHIIKTTFILFSPGKDPREAISPEPFSPIRKQIRATNFDENKAKTHLLIHDFTSNGMAGWIKHTVKSLIAIDAGNVISVDWTAGAEPPYSIAVQNARLVALEVANLVQNLLKEFSDMSPGKFYLIGHGLGAHIAGYVGQEINGIGRITALDPVGLYFNDMPPPTRLDPQDALFVDVINTDIESNHGQGSGDPFGHVNFFPNGGLTQIGCNVTELYPSLDEISRDMLKEGETAPGCNHKRATKYFTASIDELSSKCTMMGYACGDYSAFKRGECITECKEGSTCAPMGYSAHLVSNNCTASSTTKFFLDTNDCPPYCMFAYKIIIALSAKDTNLEPAENKPQITVSGMFCATVFSDSEDIMFRTNLNVGMGEKLLNVAGDNVFLTYQKAPRITKPDKILLRFESENNDTIAYVRHVEIGHLPERGDPATRLCGMKDPVTPLKNHAEAYFTDDQCDRAKSMTDEPPVVATAPRERRNPGEKAPASEDLEVSDYEEDEPPEPAEDDYYTNR